MLERPYLSDHLSFERESYFRRRQLLEQQCMVERLSQIPREKLKGYNEPLAVYGNRGQMPVYLAQYDTFTAITKPVARSSYTKKRTGSVSGSNAGANANINANQRAAQSIYRNYLRVKQNTPVFGSLHSEHARKFYQSKGSQPTYPYHSQLIPPYDQNVQYVYMPVYFQAYNPVSIKRDHYFNEPRYAIQRPQHRKQEFVKSEPRTPIFKIATISPRPGCAQNKKARSSLKVGDSECTSKEIEDRKLLSRKIEKELTCSPIFQILGEISRAG